VRQRRELKRGETLLENFFFVTFHEPHEKLPKEKKVKNPLPKKVEWREGNGDVRKKPRELNEKDREELSFLFNRD